MTYQEEMALILSEPADAEMATIAQVYADGVTLFFNGQTAPSQKRYQCNAGEKFAAGDRVYLAKVSGTYVVLFPIGPPKTVTTADRLATARTIALTGNTTGSGSFNGGANLNIATQTNYVRDQNSAWLSERTIQFRVAAAGKLQFKSSYYDSNYWYNLDGTRA